jgi:hypothetical protein
MRIVLSIVIWIVFVGGLWSYIHQRELHQGNRPSLTAQQLEQSDRVINISLTPTFSAEKDPFALTVDSGDSQDLTIRVNGKKLNTSSINLERGNAVSLAEIDNILAGKNELYIEVSPPVKDAHLAQALRVEIADGTKKLLDSTIWGQGGALLSGSFFFEIIDEVEHDH